MALCSSGHIDLVWKIFSKSINAKVLKFYMATGDSVDNLIRFRGNSMQTWRSYGPL